MIFGFLLIIAFLAFALLSWQNLKFALILLCGLTPTYLVRFNVGPVPTTMLEGFLLIASAIFLLKHWKTLLHAAQKRRTFSLLTISILLLALASIISIMIAPNTLSALGIWKAYYLEPFFFGLMLLTVFDRSDVKKGFIALCISGVIVALFALFQVLFHVGIPEAWATLNRATSVFPYPNAVGLLLAPIVSALLAAIAMKCVPQKFFPAVIASLVLLFLAIGSAQTEAALVAIPAALLVVALLSPSLSRKKKNALLGIGALLLVIIFAFLPSVARKLTLNDSSGLVRRAQWSETFHMLADHAYLGVGLNGYPSALGPYHDATQYEIFQYPHNIFLNVWSELGLIGLIGFLGLLVFAARFVWENKKNQWVLVCSAALLTILIHGLVDVPYLKNDLAIVTVFFFVALVTKEKEYVTKN